MSSQQIHTVRYAVRPRVIAKYWALLATMLGVVNGVPLLVAAFSGAWDMAWRLALVIAVLVGAGTPLARLSAPRQVQVNEALTVIVLSFLLGSLVMVWPFTAFGIEPLDAWFEAMSGITTSGLSTLASVEDKPFAFLFARAWMQWYGGLGMVVLSVALLLRHSAASRRLAVADATGDTLVSSTRLHAQRVLLAYVVLSGVGLVAIWIATGDSRVALLHMLSAVSTGGFSSFDDSLAGLGSRTAAVTVMTVAWCGAVSLPLYYSIWTRGVRPFLRDPELHALILATLVMIVVVYGLQAAAGHGDLFQAFVLGATAQSGTGFSASAIASLAPGVELVLMAAMLMGGCLGSTTGGVKLLRVLVLMRFAQLAIQRTGAPQHAVMEPRLAGRRLHDEEAVRALLLIALFAVLIAASWLVFVLYGYDPLDALFEVVSASATVGLSTHISRPELEPLLKAVLCFDMLAGRLEIVAVLVSLYPGTWLGKRMKSQ